MSDTKFPEDEEQMLELDFGIDTRTYWFEKHKVEGWFKQCMEDKPTPPKDSEMNTGALVAYAAMMTTWVERWFGQFKEEEP